MISFFEKIFENNMVPVNVYDDTWKMVYHNSASTRLYDKSDVVYQLFNPISLTHCTKNIKHLFVHKKRSGERVLVLANCISLVYEGFSGYVVMSHAIDSHHCYKGIRDCLLFNIERNPLLLYSDGKLEAHNSIVMGYLDGITRDIGVKYSGVTEALKDREENSSSGGEEKSLTKRESDIIFFLYRGFTVKEVSENLSISVNTVKTHLKKIYRKFSVQNRMQLINRLFKL